MLRGVSAPGTALGAHDERDARLAPEHEPVLRGLVHDLVDGEAGEVDVHELGPRPHPGEGRPDRRADEADLADRRLEDPRWAELREQVRRDLERTAMLADIFPQPDDRLAPR